MNGNSKASQIPHILVVGLVVTIVVAGVAWFVEFRPQPAAQLHSAVAPTRDEKLMAEIDREAAALVGEPRRYTSTRDLAQAAREAVKRGDFATAGRILQTSMQQSRIGDWGFRPFATLISNVQQTGDEVFLRRLDEWAAQDAGSALPYLLRAQYYRETAWATRGTRFASEVQTDHLKSFREQIDLANADIDAAIRLDGSNPYAYYLQLRVLGSRGNTPEVESAFQEAIRKFPTYYSLYDVRMWCLAPKWGGSAAELRAFVETHAGAAKAQSPLRLLYVSLYDELLDAAATSCYGKTGDDRTTCIARAMGQQLDEDLEAKVYDALQLYHHLDHYTFTMELASLLEDMVNKSGGERYAGSLLQLAADTMGSDNQLSAPDTSRNNFMMDQLSADVWYQQGHMENAEALYKRAIDDLQHTDFPSEEARDEARAQLYDSLARLYYRTNRHKEVVIYQRAAEALAGAIRPGYSHLQCASLYTLKLYDAALAACTTQIDQGENMQAAYFRGKIHEKAGRTEKALADLRRVASSEDSFRTAAAIEMSVIFGHLNDMPQMLETLNSYPFLYDADHQDKKDLAIAYNNRCYAKMRLDRLQDALDDCTASLHFDSLPDAFHKQQELIKRLNAHEKGA